MSSVALACPTIRTVVVVGWTGIDEDGSEEHGHEVVSVLAFRTRTDDRDGCREDQIMIWDRESGNLETLNEIWPEPTPRELVICPWPPEEDSDRLRGVITMVEEETSRQWANMKAWRAERDRIKAQAAK